MRASTPRTFCSGCCAARVELVSSCAQRVSAMLGCQRRRAAFGVKRRPDAVAANKRLKHKRDRLSSGPESRRAEARKVVGLATRTTNTAESDPSTAKIPKLWERFRKEHWAERLEEVRAFGLTMAVYSAYERDVNVSYQLLVGRQVRHSPLVSV